MATDDKTRSRRSSVPSASAPRSTASDTRATPPARRDLQRNDPLSRDQMSSPLGQWRSWTDQMERFFNSFGLGAAGNRIGDWNLFNPQVETFQRGDELVIRADLPGLSKDDVNLEITEDSVVIQGERRHEFEDTSREGFYRSERSYGSFYRAIPLPEGAITENAKASFRNGVLEITMPAPPHEANRGRKIEISEGGTASTSSDRSTSAASQPAAGSRSKPLTDSPD